MDATVIESDDIHYYSNIIRRAGKQWSPSAYTGSFDASIQLFTADMLSTICVGENHEDECSTIHFWDFNK